MMAADTAERTREQRLRRMAERQGLALVKSRRRDPFAKDYGLYWLVDPMTEAHSGAEQEAALRLGGHPAYRFPWSGTDLDGIEEFLTTRPEDR
jgi:hypothetical protein